MRTDTHDATRCPPAARVRRRHAVASWPSPTCPCPLLRVHTQPFDPFLCPSGCVGDATCPSAPPGLERRARLSGRIAVTANPPPTPHRPCRLYPPSGASKVSLAPSLHRVALVGLHAPRSPPLDDHQHLRYFSRRSAPVSAGSVWRPNVVRAVDSLRGVRARATGGAARAPGPPSCTWAAIL